MENAKKITLWLIIIIGIFVSYWRLFFGVDFTDESYYVALPYSFFNGRIPFVDERTLLNTSGLLATIPIFFFKLFDSSTEGIVFFFRQIFWLLMVITGIQIGNAFYHLRPRRSTMILFLAPLFFIPHNIPSLSYNTMAVAGLTIGSIGWIFQVTRTQKIVALIVLILATFAYPPLCAPISLFFIFYLFKRSDRWAIFYFVGLFLIATVLLSTVGLNTLLVKSSAHNLNIDRFVSLVTYAFQMWSWFFSYVTLAGIVICLIGRAKKNWDLVLAGVALGYLGCYIVNPNLFLLRTLVFSALTWLVLPNFKERKILFELWVFGILCGLLTAFASTNGWLNLCIGAFPSFVASLGALLVFQDNLKYTAKFRLGTFTVLSMLFTLGSASFLFCYRDVDTLEARAEIESGPYKGLWTTDENLNYIVELQTALEHIPNSANFIALYSFPSAYLMTNVRAKTPTLFFHQKPLSEEDEDLKFFKDESNFPDYALWIHTLPLGATGILVESKDDPIRNIFFSSRYQSVFKNEKFSILKRVL